MEARRATGLVAVLAALAVVSACGGDDDGRASAAEVVQEETAMTPDMYQASVREITEDVAREVDVAAQPIAEAFESGDDQRALAELAERTPEIVSVNQDGIERLEALEPPQTYEDDHRSYIEGQRALADEFRSQAEAAAAGDMEAVNESFARVDEIYASLREELSPEFQELAADLG